MGEVELSAYSPLSEERTIVLKKLIEVMDLVCYIHDVDFCSSAEKHEVNVEKKVD